LPPGESFAGALAAVFEAFDQAGIAIAPLRFLFDDAPGGQACSRVLQRFPDLAPFAVRTPAPFGQPASVRLSNLDGRWQGGNPDASGEPSRETLLAVAAGIPVEFPLWIASLLIGPVRWNAASGLELREAAGGRSKSLGKPPFSGISPSMTYLASGVILQRLSSGGLRLWITEQLPDDAPNAAAAPAVQQLLERFGPVQTDVPMSVPDDQAVTVAPPQAADLNRIHAGYKERMGEIVAGLSFPFEPPSPSQWGQLPHAPLGKIRAVIAFSRRTAGNASPNASRPDRTNCGSRLPMDATWNFPLTPAPGRATWSAAWRC
jgi:hypothetical protein